LKVFFQKESCWGEQNPKNIENRLGSEKVVLRTWGHPTTKKQSKIYDPSPEGKKERKEPKTAE